MQEIICGDAIEELKKLPDLFAQTCITSPPYWGLRDYGSEGQIGQEESPWEYIDKMVDVFKEVRRVLRDDGTLWLNLGDTYIRGSGDSSVGQKMNKYRDAHRTIYGRPVPQGLKPKDLAGIPWRVALALQEDGWWLRSDIIWSKPNPMPESITDRPTSCHEHIFLFAKSSRYFYDADSIREPHETTIHRLTEPTMEHGSGIDYTELAGGKPRNRSGKALAYAYTDGVQGNPLGRNKRDVWTITTRSYPDAHFAVFPTVLIEPCVLAGSSSRACESCGAPWKIDREIDSDGSIVDKGWRPSCKCENQGTSSSLVIDPFLGSGTTGLVALEHRRRFVGIEINPEYCALAKKRLREVQIGLF